MARLDQPIRKVVAVFVVSVSIGATKYRREPYNIVSLDFGDGSPVNTYIEPICGRALSPLERKEEYDEVRYYPASPYPGTQIGYGSAGQ